MAAEQRFFHWCVEFPEVFAANKGFDVMCGNPPWDKLQMEEEKWFAGKDEDIVKAANQAERKEKIAKLQTSAPKLYVEFTTACNALTSQSNFAKNSGRFPLTAVGNSNFRRYSQNYASLSQTRHGDLSCLQVSQ